MYSYAFFKLVITTDILNKKCFYIDSLLTVVNAYWETYFNTIFLYIETLDKGCLLTSDQKLISK